MKGGLFMTIENDRLKDMVVWFNRLEINDKNLILRYVKINSLFKLEENDIDHIKILRDFVVGRINHQEDKNIISETLTEMGLEKEDVNSLVLSIERYIDVVNDSKSISMMEPDKFRRLIDFIINNVILYKEFNHIPFSEFVGKFNFADTNEAKTVLRYIRQNILLVSSRKIGLETSRKMLMRQYDIPEELCNIFYIGVEENIVELREAFLLQRIDNLNEMLLDIIKENDLKKRK